MGLFGGSKSHSSSKTTQVGAEGQSTIATGGSHIIDNFPERVAKFADSALDLAGKALASGASSSNSNASALAEVAKREKTPIAEWMPIVSIVGVVVAIIGIGVYRR